MTWLLLALLSTGAPAQDRSQSSAAPPSDPRWAVSTSRILGAAGTTRVRAWQLNQTAQAAIQAGRASHLSAIAADAKQLNQAVASAVLAAQAQQRALIPSD